jgi:predicted glycosyltransferase
MTEPPPAQLRIAAEPVLPLATLTELRRLTDAALFSPAFVTRKETAMRQRRIRQVDLFDQIEPANNPWPMELNAEAIVLLAQLMYSLIETIEKEASNEQD